MFRFEIDENNAVSIFQDDNVTPIIFQPNWPNGQSWSASEAQGWAAQYIASLTDETADLPGDSPDHPTKPRPEIIIEPEVE